MRAGPSLAQAPSSSQHPLRPTPFSRHLLPAGLHLSSRPSKQDQGQHRWSHRVTARPKYKKTATAPIKPKRPQSSPPTVLFPFTARLPGESSPGPFRAEHLEHDSGHHQPMSSPRQISWNSGDRTNLFFCVKPSFSGLQGAVCRCLAPNTSPTP